MEEATLTLVEEIGLFHYYIGLILFFFLLAAIIFGTRDILEIIIDEIENVILKRRKRKWEEEKREYRKGTK